MILSKTLRLLNNKSVNKEKSLYKIHDLILQLKSLKKRKTAKMLEELASENNSVKLQKHKNVKKNNFIEHINYTIHIKLSLTNTFVSVTDIKGNVLISLSAGSVKLKKRQKRTQPLALVSVFKELFLKTQYLNNKIVAIHFHNVKPYHESLVIKLLKSKVFLKTVRSYNLHPHNGCRPKKLKRFKQRTRR